MSEHSQESTETTDEVVSESIEDALARNLAAASDQTVSTETAPDADDGDVTSNELEAETEQESEVEATDDALEPLEKWTDEQKEMFRGLDPQAQQFLLDRNKDVESHLTKETQSLSEVRKGYEKLDEVLKPYMDALRPRGIDIEPHLANAMQYYFAYQQDPVQTVKNLIESAGLSQDQFFEDESVDPSIRALRSELQEAKREIANLKSEPVQQEESQAQKQLEEFTQAKKEDGSLQHPHFEQVKSLMAPLVNNGKSLEDAYNEVLWTLPDYRKEQLDKSEKKAKDELEAARRKKAEKAKKAADVLPPSNVDTSTGQKPANNWNEALKLTLDKLGG